MEINLQKLLTTPHAKLTNPDGSVEHLSEERRQAMIKDAQDFVDKNCH